MVVASHGGLATALLEAAAMISGPADHATAVGLDPTDSPETYRERLLATITPGRPTLLGGLSVRSIVVISSPSFS